VCPSCGHHEEIFLRGGGRKLAERENLTFLGEIPLQGAVARGGDAGKPVVLADPGSQVAQLFQGIASAIACQLSVKNTPEPGAGKRSPKLTTIR
jgi:ATP-binding protein involved in chromosome partitioning